MQSTEISYFSPHVAVMMRYNDVQIYVTFSVHLSVTDE